MKIQFGEKVKGYKVRVLNEREVRAAAGIVFTFALISFLRSWFTGDFFLMKIFIISFLVDFGIRIFLNPRYSPSLILGRIATSNQQVEYAGAAQKKFAWTLGWLLSVTMFFVLVVNGIVGPLNMLLCLTCLTLLFFESIFGICLGCYAYNYFKKDEYQLCPGGSCEVREQEPIQHVSFTHALIVVGFLIFLMGVKTFLSADKATVTPQTTTSSEQEAGEVRGDCVVPEWAASIGHKDLWKKHNGCD